MRGLLVGGGGRSSFVGTCNPAFKPNPTVCRQLDAQRKIQRRNHCPTDQPRHRCLGDANFQRKIALPRPCMIEIFSKGHHDYRIYVTGIYGSSIIIPVTYSTFAPDQPIIRT